MVLASREFIAVPDDKKNQIVFKWPDVRIRKFTRAIVDADELALFINTGQVIGTMGPGRHQIDAQELPFLGAIIDFATGGNAYRAELYFVHTREFPGNTFGGRIDDVQDPQTGNIVTLRVFGDYSLQVKDPAALITNLVGTVDVQNNERVAGWVSDQLLKVMRTEVTRQIVRNGWPVLGLSAYTPDLEQTIIPAANNQLATYGVALVRMGNFDVNLSEADEATLKGLAKDTAYSRLAGGFNRYAAGEMALGAGQGMAQGGSGDSGAFLAAGLGLGGQLAGGVAGYGPGGEPGPVPPPAPGFSGGGGGFAAPTSGAAAPAPAATVTCPNCHASQPAGTKFCSSCGTAMPPPAGHCANCGTDNVPNARFCSGCGQPLGPQPVHCPSCGTEMAPGQRFCSSCGTAIAPPAAAATASPASTTGVAGGGDQPGQT
ncbi:MAG TPA: SPFH domain-containing protein [Acidimicrobiales bacterium]|nr:SPFH domain-containing protein [Acidimicrobiales bacterium]